MDEARSRIELQQEGFNDRPPVINLDKYFMAVDESRAVSNQYKNL